jgi:hypothetical protein
MHFGTKGKKRHIAGKERLELTFLKEKYFKTSNVLSKG